MSRRAAGIKDVARAAGVSVTTVSHVLNEVPGSRVAEETRSRVHEAVADLGYTPNRMARGLRTQRSGILAMVSDNIATTPFAGRMILGAQDEALRRGYSLMLVTTGADADVEARQIDALLQHQVDGVLYATMYHQVVTVPAALEGVPTVLLDARAPDGAPGPRGVVPDEEAGGRTATEELLAAGHRRIGYLQNADDIPASRGRRAGYQAALARAGVVPDPTLVAVEDSDPAGGHRAALRLLDRPDRPTALFCFNDRMAMGAYRAATELGLSIPRDVSVIGFDDQPVVAEGLYPGLTTVALPHYDMAVWAVDALLRLVDRDGGPGADGGGGDDQRTVLLPCPIVRRSSVAPPPRGPAAS